VLFAKAIKLIGAPVLSCRTVLTALLVAGSRARASGMAQTIYEFTAKDIDGNQQSLAKYKGNVVLIVNVACK